MSRIERTPFTRNLRGFLGASWLSRTASAARITRISRPHVEEPIDATSAAFTTLSEYYGAPDHFGGFEAITRQILANDVLGSLIQAQSDMLSMDEGIPYEPDIYSAHASEIYRRTQDNFPEAGTGAHS